MPEFDETANFPRECDNLHNFSLFSWNSLLFWPNPSFKLKIFLKQLTTESHFYHLKN